MSVLQYVLSVCMLCCLLYFQSTDICLCQVADKPHSIYYDSNYLQIAIIFCNERIQVIYIKVKFCQQRFICSACLIYCICLVHFHNSLINVCLKYLHISFTGTCLREEPTLDTWMVQIWIYCNHNKQQWNLTDVCFLIPSVTDVLHILPSTFAKIF